MQGAFDLLKPRGVFVLNIADIKNAPRLEKDARILSSEVGFVNGGFYKLAMSVMPHLRAQKHFKHETFIRGKQFKHEPVFVFQKPNTQTDETK